MEKSLKTVTKATSTKESNYPMTLNTPPPPKIHMSTRITSKNKKYSKVKSVESKSLPFPMQLSINFVKNRWMIDSHGGKKSFEP